MVERVKSPLLGLFAGADHGITPEMVKEFEARLQKSGVAHEVHVYPGTQHAFFNDTRPQIFEVQAAQEAWKRTLDWFRRHLA